MCLQIKQMFSVNCAESFDERGVYALFALLFYSPANNSVAAHRNFPCEIDLNFYWFTIDIRERYPSAGRAILLPYIAYLPRSQTCKGLKSYRKCYVRRISDCQVQKQLKHLGRNIPEYSFLPSQF